MNQPTLKKIVLGLLGIFTSGLTLFAQPQFQAGQDPKPNNKKWVKVENLSDEFNGNSLNSNKWLNTDYSWWKGRVPGLFKKNSVSVGNGKLRITNSKLSSPEYVDGNRYDYACGYVRSKNRGQVGCKSVIAHSAGAG